jgi:hypothetical protein
MGVLNRIKKQFGGTIMPSQEPAWTEDERPRIRDEATIYVPASVRGPEMQRFQSRIANEIDVDAELEEDDEDIEFLTSLASQIDADPPIRRTRVSAASVGPKFKDPERIEVKEQISDATAMNIFREQAPVHERSNSPLLDVKEVEMDDLLETLQTTAVALRQRMRELKQLERAA